MRVIELTDGKTLVLSTLREGPGRVAAPFAALLPSENTVDICDAAVVAAQLSALGCSEFCCVGALSEQLHDAIDEIVEDAGRLDVMTTWFTSANEAAEYFILVAGMSVSSLLAFVEDRDEFVSRILAEVS